MESNHYVLNTIFSKYLALPMATLPRAYIIFFLYAKDNIGAYPLKHGFFFRGLYLARDARNKRS